MSDEQHDTRTLTPEQIDDIRAGRPIDPGEYVVAETIQF